MEKGTLYGVSIGPGDPELITVKAMNIISECKYIATPHTELVIHWHYQLYLKQQIYPKRK